MACPALCVLAPDKSFANSHHYFISNRKRDVAPVAGNIHCQLHQPWSTPEQRFDNISNTVMSIIQGCVMDNDPHVWIEDYAMGAKGRVFAIGELTGLLKHKLHQAQIPFDTVPPTVVKKWTTGKGNADKERMYRAFLARGNTPDLMKWYYNKDDAKVASPVSDIVDAYMIACYGAEQCE